jgi:xylulokinase
VVLLGGGAKSPAYRQVLADLLQQPVVVRNAPEASARGACIQAAAVLHGEDVTRVRDAWTPPDLVVVEPAHQRADIYDRYLMLADWTGPDQQTHTQT